MRILDFFKKYSFVILSLLFSSYCFSQTSKNIKQDPKFEQLLAEKRKVNSSITINDRYKIQIFTGEAEASKKALQDFKKANKNIDATVVFHTPIYKVWVGSFKTRIDAEKKLQELKKKFPNAFLVKPNK
jgi:hypothetical protein